MGFAVLDRYRCPAGTSCLPRGLLALRGRQSGLACLTATLSQPSQICCDSGGPLHSKDLSKARAPAREGEKGRITDGPWNGLSVCCAGIVRGHEAKGGYTGRRASARPVHADYALVEPCCTLHGPSENCQSRGRGFKSRRARHSVAYLQSSEGAHRALTVRRKRQKVFPSRRSPPGLPRPTSPLAREGQRHRRSRSAGKRPRSCARSTSLPPSVRHLRAAVFRSGIEDVAYCAVRRRRAILEWGTTDCDGPSTGEHRR